MLASFWKYITNVIDKLRTVRQCPRCYPKLKPCIIIRVTNGAYCNNRFVYWNYCAFVYNTLNRCVEEEKSNCIHWNKIGDPSYLCQLLQPHQERIFHLFYIKTVWSVSMAVLTFTTSEDSYRVHHLGWILAGTLQLRQLQSSKQRLRFCFLCFEGFDWAVELEP